MKKAYATGLVVLVLVICVFGPRLHLPGKIPSGQPQWSLRAQWFWDALSAGELNKTYLAPHPGLTTMWYAGAAQRLSGEQGQFGQMVAASRANAIVGGLLILIAVWLVRRVLDLDEVEETGAVALAFGLVLALDPLMILMTGLVGLDGVVSLFMLVGFLLMALHMRTGSLSSLVAAGLGTGLAVATKVPGLLLLPMPLLWLGAGPRRQEHWPWVLLLLAVLIVGAALVTWVLLPAAWTNPLDIAKDLLLGQKAKDESLREVVASGHLQFFMGRSVRRPGPLFYPVQLLFRITPVVLVGACLGLLVPGFRKNRLAREATLGLLLIFIGLTVTGKKTWRYISPAIPLFDLLGTLGLWFVLRYLAARWRRPATVALIWVVIAIQGVWVLNAAPYYLLRLNPIMGGPRIAQRVIPMGWGEGLEQVLEYLESEAKRLNRVVRWSGGYGAHPRKRKALEYESEWLEWKGRSTKPSRVDCHVYYIAEEQRGLSKLKPADKSWKSRGIEVLRVVEQGVELARVRCHSDLGFRPVREEGAG